MQPKSSLTILSFLVLFTSYNQVSGNSTKVESSPTPPSPPSPPIVEVSQISYRGSIIRIFADASMRKPMRFFFEPLVQLDPKTIIAHHYSVLQEDVVSFTIEMWNNELRREVFTHLRSLNATVEEHDIQVLPFKRVRLTHTFIAKITDPLAKLVDEPKSYFRQHENLTFYILCNSTEIANAIAREFRQNPGFMLDNRHVSLVGQGLVLGDNQLGDELGFVYPVSTSPVSH